MRIVVRRSFLVAVALLVLACGASAHEPELGAAGGGAEGDGGGAGASVEAGGTGGEEPVETLGFSCETEGACADDQLCLTHETAFLDGEGPAGGLCSVTCETDEDCGEEAHCVELLWGEPESSVCVPRCTLGDDTSCGGREELACWPLGDQESRACLPLCNDDQQCPAGTVCDGESGLCSEWAEGGGLPVGSPCNPLETDSCADGFCLELELGGVCTAYCRRGTFPQCGGMGEAAVCGWVFPGDEAAGQADVGLCAPTCACDDDCPPLLSCALHSDREEMARPGLCVVGARPGVECEEET